MNVMVQTGIALMLVSSILLGCGQGMFSVTDPTSLPSQESSGPAVIGLAGLSILGETVTNQATLNLHVAGALGSPTQYCLKLNSTDDSDCSWMDWPLPATVTHGLTDGPLRYSAWVKNESGLKSSIVISNQVVIDTTLPAPPTGGLTNPTSPSNSLTALVRGAVDPDVNVVQLFSDALCANPLGYGTKEQFSSSGVVIVVSANSSTTIYSKAQDKAGNSSNCDLLTSYVHSISGGATLSVGFVSISPTSPANNDTPNIVGWTSSDIASVNLYANSACTTLIGNGSKSDFTGTGIVASVNTNTTTTIYGQGLDSFSASTPCTFLTTYKHDNVAPSWSGSMTMAGLSNSLNSSPSFSYLQNAMDASGIARYEYAFGSGTSGASASNLKSWTLTSTPTVANVTGLTLVDGSTYYLNMRVIDLAGNISSTASASWLVDATGPASAPTITSTNPTSPSRITSVPSVIGSATADTHTIKLYSDSSCTVQISAGSRTDFMGAGIPTSVTANTTTQIYAKAFDNAGNASSCSGSAFSFTHDNQPPTLATLVITNTNPTNSTTYNLNIGSVAGSATHWCLLENNIDSNSCSWQAFPLPSAYSVTAAQTVKTLSLWVRDAAGNISSRVDSNPVRLDTVLPAWGTPGLSYATLSTSTISSPSVTYSRNAADTSAITYLYAVGSGTSGATLNDVADWTVVTTTPFTVTGLSLVDGADYYVNMKVTDAAGNETVVPGSAPFHLDVQIPVPVFNAAIPSSPSKVSTTPSIRGSADSVVANVTLYSDSSCTSVLGSETRANFLSTGITVNLTANTSTGIYIKAFNSGATKSSVCSYFTTFLHDNLGPVSPLTVDDGALFGSNTITPTILWSGGGPDGGSGFKEFQVAFGITSGGKELSNLIPGNTDGWLSAGSVYSFSKTGLTGLANVSGVTSGGMLIDGVTYFASVRAIDNLGNSSLIAYGDGWTVDTSSPSLTLSSPAEGEYALASQREIEGACENGSIMSVVYGTGVSGPTNPTCVEGRYSLIASLTGNNGARQVTVSRTFAGNASSVVRNFNYSPALQTSGVGLNSHVYALASAEDGTDDVFIGGAFTLYGDVGINRMIKMQQDGSVRTSFSTGAGFSASVYSILPITGGKVYVGGAFTTYDGNTANRLVRLNSDGTIDTDFAMGTGLNGDVWEIIQVPSSTDIIVGGTFTTYNGVTTNRIARIRADGTLNTTDFTIGTGFNGGVYALSYDGSGYLHVGGQFTAYNGTASLGNIVRLQSNGTVANIYGTGFTGGTPIIYDLLIDGASVHVGGTFTTYQAVASRAYYVVVNSTNGSLQYTSGCNSTVYTLAKRKTNYVAGGSFTACGGQTYANRVVTLSYPSSGTAMTATDPDFAVSSGSTVQGVNGVVRALLVGSTLLNPFHKIWIGGQFTTFQAAETPYLARVNGVDGSETLDIALNVASGFNNYVETIEPMPDDSGRLYVGGQFTTYQNITVNRIVRVNADGSMDSSFISGAGFNGTVYTIKADAATGKIYVGGTFTTYNGTANVNRLARLNPDGTLDTTFINPLATTGANSTVTRILLTETSLFVGGSFTTINGVANARIVKLLKTGGFDTTFNNGSGFNNTVWSMAQPDDGSGDIYVGGNFTAYNGTSRSGIVRLNPDGTVDSGFVVGSGVTTTKGTMSVYDIEISKAVPGTLYITGIMTSYRGLPAMGIARLKNTGAIDTSFYANSITAVSDSVHFGYGYVLKERPDGVIVVGGHFSYLNLQSTTAGLAAFYSDGSVAYSAKTGVVHSIANVSDGSGDVIIGGTFTDYNALTRNRMMRVSSQGWAY
ncbi:hypothetical protein AZI86_09945 [Bdellovibrio bacteriovorus]|uniref:Uncharacterized protein n=1 Tax=Bdellovibrio bacteriovorus TaxID=959 RepID=A0A150WSQ4_BDEBC|nr:hypothetical protein [Bdellovibrio bacteriovorus]KYG67309.1 hypothetical protein AZI86_09945 [Bdellovibrio bacteriovorus]